MIQRSALAEFSTDFIAILLDSHAPPNQDSSSPDLGKVDLDDLGGEQLTVAKKADSAPRKVSEKYPNRFRVSRERRQVAMKSSRCCRSEVMASKATSFVFAGRERRIATKEVSGNLRKVAGFVHRVATIALVTRSIQQ